MVEPTTLLLLRAVQYIDEIYVPCAGHEEEVDGVKVRVDCSFAPCVEGKKLSADIRAHLEQMEKLPIVHAPPPTGHGDR